MPVAARRLPGILGSLAVLFVVVLGAAVSGCGEAEEDLDDVLIVPTKHRTIQDAVDVAEPGDLVLLSPGARLPRRSAQHGTDVVSTIPVICVVTYPNAARRLGDKCGDSRGGPQGPVRGYRGDTGHVWARNGVLTAGLRMMLIAASHPSSPTAVWRTANRGSRSQLHTF